MSKAGEHQAKEQKQLESHELFFAEEPAGQIERAHALLAGLDKLLVAKGAAHNSLRIRYSLHDYSLEGLEAALKKAGFCFKENMLNKLGKQLIFYCEEVRHHNLNTPAHLTKGNNPALFARLYDTHPHGDRDETPAELRENK